MKIWEGFDTYKKVRKAVVTTGTFDGVHLGHRKIISRLKEIAIQNKAETVLITFHPHPRMVLFPDDHELALLNSLDEKKELIAGLGVDHLVIIPFTTEFSRLSSLEFVRNILVNKIGTKKLVIGYNHHFGRNREGTFEHLNDFGPLYGFEVEEIPAQDVDSVEVSSTKIRQALHSGNIESARLYLGYDYFFDAKVVEGHKKGRELGFPTANLEIPDPHKLIPANGVYAVTSIVDGKSFKGMMNIGIRPTFNGKSRVIEAHLFDLDRDLYGETIRVIFRKRIRDEQKFSGPEALRKQLILDKEAVLKTLA